MASSKERTNSKEISNLHRQTRRKRLTCASPIERSCIGSRLGNRRQLHWSRKPSHAAQMSILIAPPQTSWVWKRSGNHVQMSLRCWERDTHHILRADASAAPLASGWVEPHISCEIHFPNWLINILGSSQRPRCGPGSYSQAPAAQARFSAWRTPSCHVVDPQDSYDKTFAVRCAALAWRPKQRCAPMRSIGAPATEQSPAHRRTTNRAKA